MQVGAGPSGLITALVLRHNGIPVRIIDKEETVRNIGQRGAGVVVGALSRHRRPVTEKTPIASNIRVVQVVGRSR